MSEKYVGVDAHQAGLVIEVMGEKGKCLMHTVIPTRADTIKEFFGGLKGSSSRDLRGRDVGGVAL